MGGDSGKGKTSRLEDNNEGTRRRQGDRSPSPKLKPLREVITISSSTSESEKTTSTSETGKKAEKSAALNLIQAGQLLDRMAFENYIPRTQEQSPALVEATPNRSSTTSDKMKTRSLKDQSYQRDFIENKILELLTNDLKSPEVLDNFNKLIEGVKSVAKRIPSRRYQEKGQQEAFTTFATECRSILDHVNGTKLHGNIYALVQNVMANIQTISWGLNSRAPRIDWGLTYLASLQKQAKEFYMGNQQGRPEPLHAGDNMTTQSEATTTLEEHSLRASHQVEIPTQISQESKPSLFSIMTLKPEFAQKAVEQVTQKEFVQQDPLLRDALTSLHTALGKGQDQIAKAWKNLKNALVVETMREPEIFRAIDETMDSMEEPRIPQRTLSMTDEYKTYARNIDWYSDSKDEHNKDSNYTAQRP